MQGDAGLHLVILLRLILSCGLPPRCATIIPCHAGLCCALCALQFSGTTGCFPPLETWITPSNTMKACPQRAGGFQVWSSKSCVRSEAITQVYVVSSWGRHMLMWNFHFQVSRVLSFRIGDLKPTSPSILNMYFMLDMPISVIFTYSRKTTID